MKQVSTIGLDLAKHVFQVHGADNEGSALFNRKLRRTEVLRFFEKTATVPGWHGGMWWRALLGAGDCSIRP